MLQSRRRTSTTDCRPTFVDPARVGSALIAPADLALISAAQRVEHYEIAAYTTARNLALQLRQPAIVRLLTMSLGEEQNAGQLLDQVAQPLMSVAKMPDAIEQSSIEEA